MQWLGKELPALSGISININVKLPFVAEWTNS